MLMIALPSCPDCAARSDGPDRSEREMQYTTSRSHAPPCPAGRHRGTGRMDTLFSSARAHPARTHLSSIMLDQRSEKKTWEPPPVGFPPLPNTQYSYKVVGTNWNTKLSPSIYYYQSILYTGLQRGMHREPEWVNCQSWSFFFLRKRVSFSLPIRCSFHLKNDVIIVQW